MRGAKISVIYLLFCTCLWGAQRSGDLACLINPKTLRMDERFLYVGDGNEVIIFGRSDLKEKVRFGKFGEGPGEFMTYNRPLIITVLPEEIAVTSMGEISFWSKSGRYLREQCFSIMTATDPIPLGADRYVAVRDIHENGLLYLVTALFDKSMTPIQNLNRNLSYWQGMNKPVLAIPRYLDYQVSGKHLYIPSQEENEIDVFDETDKKSATLSVPRSTKKVDREIRDSYMEFLDGRKNALTTPIPEIHFPEYLPSIRFMEIDDDRLYIFTWVSSAGNVLYHTFDKKSHKSLGSRTVPFRSRGLFELYPLTVWKGVLYQLVEGENEDWYLTQEQLH